MTRAPPRCGPAGSIPKARGTSGFLKYHNPFINHGCSRQCRPRPKVERCATRRKRGDRGGLWTRPASRYWPPECARKFVTTVVTANAVSGHCADRRIPDERSSCPVSLVLTRVEDAAEVLKTMNSPPAGVPVSWKTIFQCPAGRLWLLGLHLRHTCVQVSHVSSPQRLGANQSSDAQGLSFPCAASVDKYQHQNRLRREHYAVAETLSGRITYLTRNHRAPHPPRGIRIACAGTRARDRFLSLQRKPSVASSAQHLAARDQLDSKGLSNRAYDIRGSAKQGYLRGSSHDVCVSWNQQLHSCSDLRSGRFEAGDGQADESMQSKKYEAEGEGTDSRNEGQQICQPNSDSEGRRLRDYGSGKDSGDESDNNDLNESSSDDENDDNEYDDSDDEDDSEYDDSDDDYYCCEDDEYNGGEDDEERSGDGGFGHENRLVNESKKKLSAAASYSTCNGSGAAATSLPQRRYSEKTDRREDEGPKHGGSGAGGISICPGMSDSAVEPLSEGASRGSNLNKRTQSDFQTAELEHIVASGDAHYFAACQITRRRRFEAPGLAGQKLSDIEATIMRDNIAAAFDFVKQYIEPALSVITTGEVGEAAAGTEPSSRQVAQLVLPPFWRPAATALPDLSRQAQAEWSADDSNRVAASLPVSPVLKSALVQSGTVFPDAFSDILKNVAASGSCQYPWDLVRLAITCRIELFILTHERRIKSSRRSIEDLRAMKTVLGHLWAADLPPFSVHRTCEILVNLNRSQQNPTRVAFSLFRVLNSCTSPMKCYSISLESDQATLGTTASEPLQRLKAHLLSLYLPPSINPSASFLADVCKNESSDCG